METEVRRDGKPFYEIIEIGRQVNTFRKIIDKEEAKLAGLWEQWDALQNEYIKLGAEVFGAEAFGELGAEFKGQGGYKREMELLELEHSTKLKAVDEEIESIGVSLLSKMKTKEKVCFNQIIGTGEAIDNCFPATGRCCKERAGSTVAIHHEFLRFLGRTGRNGGSCNSERRKYHICFGGTGRFATKGTSLAGN